MNRITREQLLAQIAIAVSQRGTCSRKQVGALIAREGRILVTGYNGAPAGMPHCSHGKTELNEGCREAVHAEANVIAYAARHGVQVWGDDLYTTLSPCLTCAQLIINAGIHRVYYGSPYRDSIGLTLLDKAGVIVEEFPW